MLSMLIWGFIGLLLGAVVTRAVAKTIAITAVASIIGYFVMPMLNPTFVGFWLTLFLIAGVSAALSVQNERYESHSYSKLGLWTTVGSMVCLILGALFSSGMFNASTYHGLIGEVEEAVYDQKMSPVDIHQARTVYGEQARLIGEKRLGEDPGLGSRVVLDDMTIQSVAGELVWVGALKHTNFIRQIKNDFTPGYITVKATGRGEVQFVHQTTKGVEATGRETRIRYAPDHAWGYNLERHLRNNGYLTDGLTDFTFEIDDEGKPWWTVTKYTHRVLFSGPDATALILVDAETGTIQEYTLSEAPAWVDRIQPARFVVNQLDDWGQYKQGWVNSWLGRQGVVKTTTGIEVVYGRDGQAYWYTGVQSASADGSTTGFVLVNARTKEATWYPIAGWTELAAAHVTENAPGVREKRYSATFPIHYNVGGVPSYFNSLIGSDNLPKMYAFTSVVNANDQFGVGETPAEALRAYQVALRRNPNANVTDQVTLQRATLVVADKAMEVAGGESFYYLRFVGKEGLEFRAEAGLSPQLKWVKEGDTLGVSYNQPADGAETILQLETLQAQ
jgi:hypothetical protein